VSVHTRHERKPTAEAQLGHALVVLHRERRAGMGGMRVHGVERDSAG
jgi:hypothetical protein